MHLWLYKLNSKNLQNAAVAPIPALRGRGERLETLNETNRGLRRSALVCQVFYKKKLDKYAHTFRTRCTRHCTRP